MSTNSHIYHQLIFLNTDMCDYFCVCVADFFSLDFHRDPLCVSVQILDCLYLCVRGGILLDRWLHDITDTQVLILDVMLNLLLFDPGPSGL